jgi:hypothetical protein
VKRLGDARIEALSLALVDAIGRTPGLKVQDRGRAVRAVSARLKAAFQVDSSLDRAVRARIASLKRPVPETSREWDLLYRQYLDELSRRHRPGD